MSEMALLYVMTAFVIIAAIALCVQAGMLIGMYKTAKVLQQSITPLIPKVEALIPKVEAVIPQVQAVVPKVENLIAQTTAVVEKTKTVVEQGNIQVHAIGATAEDIMASAKRQVAIVEDFVGDAAQRGKVQMERVELVLDDTLSRAHETIGVVHGGIMRPLREVNGIALGLRAALGALARGNRPTVDRATSDEEMFI